MIVNPRIVGAAGVLAGVGLAVEGVLFMTSGWPRRHSATHSLPWRS